MMATMATMATMTTMTGINLTIPSLTQQKRAILMTRFYFICC